jgi:hypothetical protein
MEKRHQITNNNNNEKNQTKNKKKLRKDIQPKQKCFVTKMQSFIGK